MTLSEFILENTDDGLDMARLLIDVMNGFVRGVTLGHRLTAARLLTIYGFQDARDFIDENTLNPSGDKRQWVISDPELARLIRARTSDGQEVCLFLIDVMAGRVEGIHVGHRLSAARELLNRAFGRSQDIPLPNPPRRTAPRGTIKRTDQQVEPAIVHPVEDPPRREPVEGQSVPPARTQVQTETGQQAESATVSSGTESGVGSDPVEGQSAPPAQTQVQTETGQQAESATVSPRIESGVGSDPVEGQPEPEANDNFDPEMYRIASRCIDPNFDPLLGASDDDYLLNYDGCDNNSCPFHGDPEDHDFDPSGFFY